MTGKININISGAGASFGNVVQGNHNEISSRRESADEFALARRSAERRAAEAGVDPKELTALLKALEDLKARVDAGESEKDLATRLKDLAGGFAWALPALKALGEKILPQLVSLVFG